MKVSVKLDYALRAMLGLARHHVAGRALTIEDLATENRIPAGYLAQILIELKAKGLVKSVRGKEGGYFLVRPPSAISLGEVIRGLYGQIFDPTPPSEDGPRSPEITQAWEVLQKGLDTTADGITLQQLLDSGSEKEKMYYI